MTKHRTIFAALALSLGFAVTSSHAQNFPTDTIRIVIPSSPGGVSDPTARFLAEEWQRKWGKPVVVEHKPGAGGVLGTHFVARAAPDGHTLVLANLGPIVVTPAMSAAVPYNVTRDLVPVGSLVTFGNVLVVNPKFAAQNIRDLVAVAKKRPGSINYASAGNGQSHHLSAELFKQMADVDMVHVPYKGSGPALTDLVGGQVDLMFANIPSALQFIKTGQLRALAVTGETRSQLLPEVPTIDEAGVPGYAVTSWLALLAPAATPPAVVKRLNEAANTAWSTPDGQKVLSTINVEPRIMSADQLRVFIQEETTKWTRVIKAAGMRPDQ